MKADDFLDKVERLRIRRHKDLRAPHKPLFLLLALGRISSGASRFVSHEEIEEPPGQISIKDIPPWFVPWEEFREPMKALLKNFGPMGIKHRPDHPFRHLCNDGLWENLDGRGGFPAGVHTLLQSNPALIHQAAQKLLNLYFEPRLHERLLNAVGISPNVMEPQTFSTARDPLFRQSVMRAYEHRCAFCGYNAFMDINQTEIVFGLEAAHIKWHSQDGSNEVQNGLALCSLHHAAFDEGALGLRPVEEGSFKIVVSRNVRGSAAGQILSHHNNPVRPPQGDGDKAPLIENVAWHGKWRFQSPDMDGWSSSDAVVWNGGKWVFRSPATN